MHLTSVTHRDQLFDVATRWFGDRVEPGDGRFLTQLFVYENFITPPTLRRLMTDVLQAAYPGAARLERVRSKDEVRDAIVQAVTKPTRREAELFALYRNRRDEFFPCTPADVVLARRGDGTLAGMMRVKRMRRVAEKASRRVADRLAGEIHRAAERVAARRAAEAGVPLEKLVSSPDAMFEDFAQAERIVSLGFRDGTVAFTPDELRVDDVMGMKFVASEDDLARIERAVLDDPLVVGAQREEHRGLYNDINLLLDLRLPDPEKIVARERGRDWSAAAGRGLPVEELERGFPRYVAEGARSVRVEVILTTPAELVESEFGRSIHEQRILEQRSGAYSGRIASNASFLIEYLLMLAISPTVEIEELPIKMWGRYLSDAYAQAVWRLFGITLGLDLFDPLAAPPAHVAVP